MHADDLDLVSSPISSSGASKYEVRSFRNSTSETVLIRGDKLALTRARDTLSADPPSASSGEQGELQLPPGREHRAYDPDGGGGAYQVIGGGQCLISFAASRVRSVLQVGLTQSLAREVTPNADGICGGFQNSTFQFLGGFLVTDVGEELTFVSVPNSTVAFNPSANCVYRFRPFSPETIARLESLDGDFSKLVVDDFDEEIVACKFAPNVQFALVLIGKEDMPGAAPSLSRQHSAPITRNVAKSAGVVLPPSRTGQMREHVQGRRSVHRTHTLHRGVFRVFPASVGRLALSPIKLAVLRSRLCGDPASMAQTLLDLAHNPLSFIPFALLEVIDLAVSCGTREVAITAIARRATDDPSDAYPSVLRELAHAVAVNGMATAVATPTRVALAIAAASFKPADGPLPFSLLSTIKLALPSAMYVARPVAELVGCLSCLHCCSWITVARGYRVKELPIAIGSSIVGAVAYVGMRALWRRWIAPLLETGDPSACLHVTGTFGQTMSSLVIAAAGRELATAALDTAAVRAIGGAVPSLSPAVRKPWPIDVDTTLSSAAVLSLRNLPLFALEMIGCRLTGLAVQRLARYGWFQTLYFMM